MLAGQSKGEHFVVSGSIDFRVTGSPIERAVHDRWAIQDCAPTREIPENVSGGRIESVHLPRIGARIHDPVCDTDRAPVNGAWGRVCSLPKDLSRSNVESTPGFPRNLLSRGHQRVGQIVSIRNRDINALAIGGGTPLDATE